MTKNQNKLVLEYFNNGIAKFIGIYIKKKWLGYGIYNINNTEIGWTFTELQAKKTICEIKFDSSWRWIMRILSDIEQLNCNVGIFTGPKNNFYCSIVHFDKLGRSDKEISFINDIKIQAVYQAIIEFITWYNKNPELLK